MKSVAMRVSLALMCLLAALPAGAAVESPRVPLADAPPVDSLVAAALARSPSLAELRERVQGARERARAAGALPNPMLELMLQDVGFPSYTVGEEEMSMIGPQLTQEIPFPGKRGARRRPPKSPCASASWTRCGANSSATCACWRRAAPTLDAEDEALAEAATCCPRSPPARARAGSGSPDSEPLLAARLAQHALGERRDDLLAERAEVTSELGRLMNEGGGPALGRMRSLPATGEGDGAISPATPELAVRAAETRAAEAQLASARAERLPDLVAGAGVGFRGVARWSRCGWGSTCRCGEGEKSAPTRGRRSRTCSRREPPNEARCSWRERSRRGCAPTWDCGRPRPRATATRSCPTAGWRSRARGRAIWWGAASCRPCCRTSTLWLQARAGLARREAEGYANRAEIARIRHFGGGQTNPGGQE
jgi:hypothetical protein